MEIGRRENCTDKRWQAEDFVCGGSPGIQQRKELARHGLAGWDGRYTGKRPVVAVAGDAVAEGADDGGPAGAVGAGLEAAVEHQRMVERALAGLQLDGDRVRELFPLDR